MVSATTLAGAGSLLQGVGALSSLFRGGNKARKAQGYWNAVAQNFAREQFDEQKYLARHGIATRVADAKRAGLHPLFALGMGAQGGSPVSFSPGAIGGQADTGSGFGDAIAGVGQALSGYAGAQGRKPNAYEAQMARFDANFDRRRKALEVKQSAALNAAQVQRLRAAARADEVTAAVALSQNARAAQAANHHRKAGAVKVPTSSLQTSSPRSSLDTARKDELESRVVKALPSPEGMTPTLHTAYGSMEIPSDISPVEETEFWLGEIAAEAIGLGNSIHVLQHNATGGKGVGATVYDYHQKRRDKRARRPHRKMPTHFEDIARFRDSHSRYSRMR